MSKKGRRFDPGCMFEFCSFFYIVLHIISLFILSILIKGFFILCTPDINFERTRWHMFWFYQLHVTTVNGHQVVFCIVAFQFRPLNNSLDTIRQHFGNSAQSPEVRQNFASPISKSNQVEEKHLEGRKVCQQRLTDLQSATFFSLWLYT